MPVDEQHQCLTGEAQFNPEKANLSMQQVHTFGGFQQLMLSQLPRPFSLVQQSPQLIQLWLEKVVPPVRDCQLLLQVFIQVSQVIQLHLELLEQSNQVLPGQLNFEPLCLSKDPWIAEIPWATSKGSVFLLWRKASSRLLSQELLWYVVQGGKKPELRSVRAGTSAWGWTGSMGTGGTRGR